MAEWPSDLPNFATPSGYQESFGNNIIRSGMDLGPAKLRRRATAAVRVISFTQTLTSEQIQILESFYLTTLQHGSLPFTWTHPRTGIAIANVQFAEPPSITPSGGGNYFEVSYKLTQIPQTELP